MIASIKRKKTRLDKRTIQTIRLLARKGSDTDLEDFVFGVAMRYISDVRGADYIRHDKTMLIDRDKYTITCPECGVEIEIDLEAIEKND